MNNAPTGSLFDIRWAFYSYIYGFTEQRFRKGVSPIALQTKGCGNDRGFVTDHNQDAQ